MKKITKKLSMSLLGLSAAFIVNAETVGEWKDSPNGFDYQSKGLSCKIEKNGKIQNLKTPNTLILSQAFIHASPVIADGEKYDARISQQNKCASIKVKSDGPDSYSLILKGMLGNAKHKEIAEYTEKITLTPATISFDYEVVLKEPLSMKSYNPFFSLEYAPCSILKGLGYVTIDAKDKKKFCQFPPTYSKSNSLHKGGVKALRIVFPDGHIVFSVKEKAYITLSDTRAWGSKNFRIDVKPYYPYKAKPIDFPAGSKIQWSYSISLENK